MKEWKKKNNPKMQARRKEAEEKRLNDECPPPIELEANENQKEEEEGNRVRSKYDTIPYIPPATWDNDALSERTKSLGFVEYASFDEVEPDWSKRVRASCFPLTEEGARRFELHKCLRSLPQVNIVVDHFLSEFTHPSLRCEPVVSSCFGPPGYEHRWILCCAVEKGEAVE